MKGLDLDVYEKTGRFAFVDGLEGLFLNADQPQERGQRALHGPNASRVEQAVSSAIEVFKRPGQRMREKEAVLIVDSIDFYLAATETGVNSLQDTIGEWREVSSDPLVLSNTFPRAIFPATSIVELLPLAEMISACTFYDFNRCFRLPPNAHASHTT